MIFNQVKSKPSAKIVIIKKKAKVIVGLLSASSPASFELELLKYSCDCDLNINV